MRRRPESTAALAAPLVQRGGRGMSFAVPAGAIVTSVAPAGVDGPTARSMTAAAQVLSGLLSPDSRIRINSESWQKEVFDLRHEVGELRFIVDRQAAAASQYRLFIGSKPSPDAEPSPVTEGVIAELSEDMFGDVAANQQALRRAAQHYGYTGESEIVVTERAGDRSWYPWSVQEVTGSAQMGWKINDGIESRDLGEDDLLIRTWTPDPATFTFADAPTRAMLPVLRELVGLTKYVAAQIDSRLAGAGLLLVPQGIVPMTGQGFDGMSFADALLTSMVTPIKNRESAASVVPLIGEVDPNLIDKITHLKFDSVLDPKAHELRDEAIRRVGLGLDSDPSILLGAATTNHWSAWLVSDQERQMAITPIVSTVCHGLTSGWLRPYLTAAGVANANDYQVWFDATPLEIRPDRSKDAVALHTAGVISDESLRRENGFGDDDAPSQDEVKQRVLRELIATQPDLISAFLQAYGITLADPIKINSQTPAAPAPDPAPDIEPDEQMIPSTIDDRPQQ